MKSTFIFFLVALFLLSCKNDKMSNTAEAIEVIVKPSLVGVWQMVGYYNYTDNKVSDSFMSSDIYKQIKIYSPTKVMWSRINKLDSTDWFGYGDYKTTDSTLVETINYGSNSMNKAIEKNNVFHFALELKEHTYNQIELDENGDRILAEKYNRVE